MASMTTWGSGRARRWPGWVVLAVAAAAGAGCGGPARNAPDAPASAASTPPLAGDGDALAQLRRERDDAEHRARDAQRAANDAQGRCDLTQHELESLRERDSFEEAVWSRLGQAEISENALRERAAGTPRPRRLPLDAALKDAAEAHASIEHALRRVHSVPDTEWARYRHDIESNLDGLDRMLRDSP